MFKGASTEEFEAPLGAHYHCAPKGAFAFWARRGRFVLKVEGEDGRVGVVDPTVEFVPRQLTSLTVGLPTRTRSFDF
jgi:hypothetical protein